MDRLEGILGFPGNLPVWRALNVLLREQKAVAFVGAGASAPMYPLWGTFVEKLADHAVDQGKAAPKDAARWKADTSGTPQQRVNTIVRKLGEPLYRNFLKETFGPRKGPDGKRYTVTHTALLRLPFRGFVTTNYDPALEFARAELRPESLSTGTPTWQDDDVIYRWRTGDVFDEDTPILWLHGYWQRPAGIVLNSGEYSEAYKPSIYRQTFGELWVRERLAFVGFGFNDPQFNFMVGEFLRELSDAAPAPRHVAILGWPMPADGSVPDAEEINEKRESLEADYHVRAHFYPVHGTDHSALGVLLAGLDASSVRTRSSVASNAHAVVQAVTAFSSRWVHETTNDAKFTGRSEELRRLDRWVGDEAVRVIGICAVGGTGKTSLVGHWLKNTTGWRRRPFAGLFGWSFYQERSTASFLESLLDWAHDTLGAPKREKRTDLVDQSIALLRDRALVVVLDGLEVLQEAPREASHGSFLEPELRELLHALCQLERTASVAVLTSRFVFTDLERHLGTTFHQIDLPGLDPPEGGHLLAQLRVRGTTAEREEVSGQLEGHPLGLRIFAWSLPDAHRDGPLRFLRDAFSTGSVPEGAPLNDKLRRLLEFYEKALPDEQVRILSIVALFRSSVAEPTILRLVNGLFTDVDSHMNPTAMAAGLRSLHRYGILTREPIRDGHGFACHPILREHFRGVLLGRKGDVAVRAADLLTREPSAARPRTVKEIEPVLIAIGLLVDANEFEQADELYRTRLDFGQVFQSLPAPAQGSACALGFVRDETRRRECAEQLSEERLAFYLNEVGVSASMSGHFEVALEYYSDATRVYRECGNAMGVSTLLQNQAELLVLMGRLAEAYRTAEEALHHAVAANHMSTHIGGYIGRGRAGLLTGRTISAACDLATAKVLQATVDRREHWPGVWAELHRLTGHVPSAVRIANANLEVCRQEGMNDLMAECRLLLAACALDDGRPADADLELRFAEPVLQRAHLLHELARLHVLVGRIALAEEDAPRALNKAGEALSIAAPRLMRLVHADALILRGKARLLNREPDRAQDDAIDAVRIARDCGYAWGERDALRLLDIANTALAQRHAAAGESVRADRCRADALRFRRDADAIAARLVLTEADLADAHTKAKAWLVDWDKSQKGRKRGLKKGRARSK